MENESVSRYYAAKKRRKKRKKLMFYTLLTVLMVIVIAVLSLTVFFNISHFEVNGSAHYSDSQIIEASELKEGQNMFRLNKFKIINRLKSALPYLSEVTIRRKLQSSMSITVVEAEAFAYLQSGGGYSIVDENLKVLEKVTSRPEGLTEIKGFKAESAEVGQTLTSSEDTVQTLLYFTRTIKDVFGEGGITEITAEKMYELGFVYDGRITVLIGTAQDLDEKLKLVKYTIDENPSKEYARIDASANNQAVYRSTEAPEEEETGVDKNADREDDKENE